MLAASDTGKTNIIRHFYEIREIASVKNNPNVSHFSTVQKEGSDKVTNKPKDSSSQKKIFPEWVGVSSMLTVPAIVAFLLLLVAVCFSPKVQALCTV